MYLIHIIKRFYVPQEGFFFSVSCGTMRLGGTVAFFRAVALAFSMFSRLPVPRVAWSERHLRYMLCAFPLVGAAVGAVVGAAVALTFARADGLLAALCVVVLPVAVTGGIHLDGFMDTCDALACHAGRSERLAVMEDSRAGAFAVLGCALYLLAQYVLALVLCRTTAGRERLASWACVCASFVLSRLLSALAVAVFPAAKERGLLRTFADAAARRFTAVWCVAWFAAAAAAMAWCGGRYGVAAAGAQVVTFAGYFGMTKRQFGGITGDTAGWFVQVSELLSLAAVAVTAVWS